MKWFWLIRIDGSLTVSTPYDDWDACYEDYCDNMKGISDLGDADFRGVYSHVETECIIKAHCKGEHIGDALLLLNMDFGDENNG